jgi:hypothetical protein
LDLRNARADEISGLDDAWPWHVELRGFTYRDIGEIHDRSSAFGQQWFARLGNYSPQPYEQLAQVLDNQGQHEHATAVRFTGRERERSESHGLRWLGLTILWAAIGYGYYSYVATLWAVVLIVAGAIVLRLSGQGLANLMPFGIAYSFDMLLPIVRLRERHYKDVDLIGWARYYFYAHKIMGYLLAFFLIAGLSGLTK